MEYCEITRILEHAAAYGVDRWMYRLSRMRVHTSVHLYHNLLLSETRFNEMRHLQAYGWAWCQLSLASCMQHATYLAHAVRAEAFAIRVTVSIPAPYPPRAVATSTTLRQRGNGGLPTSVTHSASLLCTGRCAWSCTKTRQ